MRPIWIILISVLATTVVIGGGTYYVVNAKAVKDKDSLQTQITDLNKKFDDSQTALADAQTSADNLSTSAVADDNTSPSTTQTVSLNKDIEKVDFSKIIKANIALGDKLLSPTYADLDNDNSEEALVVYQYAGSGSAIDFYIYKLKDGNTSQLYKKTGLSGGTATIKNQSVYVDYINLNSATNAGKPDSDLQIDTHIKYTWNGSTFVQSNQ